MTTHKSVQSHQDIKIHHENISNREASSFHGILPHHEV